MSLMTLFKRRDQSQSQALALVQAPSADLIVSDTGPRLPKPVEITCQMTTEQFEAYMKTINLTKDMNLHLKKECLKQVLKTLNYHNYHKEELRDFSRRMSGKLPDWTYYKDYEKFLPPKIINRVLEIKNHPYCPNKVSFFIGEINCHNVLKTPPTNLCVLIVTSNKISAWMFNSKEFDNYHMRESLIIDAWRGPTFSDEEARLP